MKKKGYSMMRTLTLFVVALALLPSMPEMLQAQSATGQITGTVSDATGAVVPNAKVTLTNQRTGLTRDTTANESGVYAFPLLSVGVYSVSAEQQGFSVAKRSDITLNVDQVVRVDLQLAVGQTTETVYVQSTAITIDTDTAGVGQVVTTRQITAAERAQLPATPLPDRRRRGDHR
jgi:carboxypeptidase family protein